MSKQKIAMLKDMLRVRLECAMEQARAGGEHVLVLACEGFEQDVKDLIAAEGLKISQFSLKELAEGFVKLDEKGRVKRRLFEHLDPRSMGEARELLEAGSPLTSTLFPTLTGQLIIAEVRDAYMDEEFIFSRLVSTIPSDTPASTTEAGPTAIGDQGGDTVLEGREFPRMGFGEFTQTMPAKSKRGGICEVTREAIRFDRTATIVKQARAAGNAPGLKKEKQIVKVIVGATNNYIRNGTGTNTYLLTGAYVNRIVGVPFVDWNSLDEARKLATGLRDPDTNEPISFQMPHLVVTPARQWLAEHVLNATEARRTTGGGDDQRVGPNPAAGRVTPYTSVRLRDAILAGPESDAAKADDGTIVGDLSKAFGWLEVWDLETEELGRGSDAAFYRDIEFAVKGSIHGEAAVLEPRAVVRMENAQWTS